MYLSRTNSCSVIYNEHKGWYSFVLGSSYGFLLTFGFIMMTPQVVILEQLSLALQMDSFNIQGVFVYWPVQKMTKCQTLRKF